MTSSPEFKCEYSKELDNELKLLLKEYRNGDLKVEDLLKLVDAACRDHLDFRMLGSINGRKKIDNSD